jgi:hypothetical protein
VVNAFILKFFLFRFQSVVFENKCVVGRCFRWLAEFEMRVVKTKFEKTITLATIKTTSLIDMCEKFETKTFRGFFGIQEKCLFDNYTDQMWHRLRCF